MTKEELEELARLAKKQSDEAFEEWNNLPQIGDEVEATYNGEEHRGKVYNCGRGLISLEYNLLWFRNEDCKIIRKGNACPDCNTRLRISSMCGHPLRGHCFKCNKYIDIEKVVRVIP